MRQFQSPADVIVDNAIVADIAREAGVFQKIVGSNTLAHGVTGLLHSEHPTHWLLFACITGMSDPAENGLILSALDKSDFGPTEAMAQFHAMLASTQCQDGYKVL